MGRVAGQLQAARCGDRRVSGVSGDAGERIRAAVRRLQGDGRDGRAQLSRVVLRLAPLRPGSAEQRDQRAPPAGADPVCQAGAGQLVVQPGSARDSDRDDSRLDGCEHGPRALPVCDREPVSRAGARARRAGRAADVVRRALQQRPVRQLFRADDGGREVSVDHARERHQGDADLWPVSRRARNESESGRPRERLPDLPSDVCRQPEHLRGALQRRAAARLVPRTRPRLHDDARRGAAWQQHSDVGRREPDRGHQAGRRAAATLSPPAPASARLVLVSAVRRVRAAGRTWGALSVRRGRRVDRGFGGAPWQAVSAEREERVRRAVDRRVREQREAQRRILGAGVRRASLHAAQLQRNARRGVHAGPRDGTLDAHAAVASDAAVRLRRLHDLRRRGALDAQRGAVPRPDARSRAQPRGAHRAAAARDRQHREHVLHAGDVRGLRAAGASAGGARSAGDGGRAQRHLLVAARGVLRRRHRPGRVVAVHLGAHPAFLQHAVLRLPVRDLLRVDCPSDAGNPLEGSG